MLPIHEKALEEFTAKWKKNKQVIGIVACGSIVEGHGDKNSDIDVQIILDKSNWRERGNTFINGIEIEYFVNPAKKIKEYFKKEQSDKRPSTAGMLSFGRVIYKKGPILDQLLKEANKLLKQKPAKATKYEKEITTYMLDDDRKDLDDVFTKHDAAAFQLLKHRLIERCIAAFNLHKELFTHKGKRMLRTIQKIDPEFTRLLSEALEQTSMEEGFAATNKLVDYTEKLFGGKRAKEWKSRTKL